MWILNVSLQIIDWFISATTRSGRSELSRARNFVFTYLAGPLLSQSISVFLYRGSTLTIRILAWMNEELRSEKSGRSTAAPSFAVAV
jgi:hypothetical protein